MNNAVRPFKIQIAQEQIDDLRRRLASTRWPDPVVADFSHGQALAHIKELADYWSKDFDWRAQEKELNQYPQ